MCQSRREQLSHCQALTAGCDAQIFCSCLKTCGLMPVSPVEIDLRGTDCCTAVRACDAFSVLVASGVSGFSRTRIRITQGDIGLSYGLPAHSPCHGTVSSKLRDNFSCGILSAVDGRPGSAWKARIHHSDKDQIHSTTVAGQVSSPRAAGLACWFARGRGSVVR